MTAARKKAQRGPAELPWNVVQFPGAEDRLSMLSDPESIRLQWRDLRDHAYGLNCRLFNVGKETKMMRMCFDSIQHFLVELEKEMLAHGVIAPRDWRNPHQPD